MTEKRLFCDGGDDDDDDERESLKLHPACQD
jgi:hypothetical protein